MSSIRPAAVAGMFYPASAAALANEVTSLLAGAADGARGKPAPKAIIAPHAGYIYSGPVAASVYARLASARGIVKRVVLLGPVHRVPVRGLALPDAQALATPLGNIEVDAAAVAQLKKLPQVTVSAAAHAQEHSLEVHLPFLQQVLGEFTLVPLAVGDATAEEVAQVLDTMWGGAETLIVISSDLSHYLGYGDAQAVDRVTAQAILDLRSEISHEQACGGTPVNGLLQLARKRGLVPELVDLRNSGDTAGDRRRVVGYASFAFNEPAGRRELSAEDARETLYGERASSLPHDAGNILLPLARASIAAELGLTGDAREDAGWLANPGASFVTLTKQGELRGCIGTLEAHRALGADIKANAVAAAMRDPRFKPLTRAEFAEVRVEVSVLSAVEPMQYRDEADALAQLRPGIDGVIFQYGYHRSTFLPQVWESFSDPHVFIGHLKHKAGLPPDFWDPAVSLSRYTVAKWREETFVVTYAGRWWHMLDDGRMQCDLCPRDCRLHEGQRGACFVRQRVGDWMILTTYGRSSGFCIDPIEKKPLNHFYPGSSVLSFGTAGCNLACKFCQNWDISKSKDMDRLADQASPETIADAAVAHGCKSIAFTYNDPVIFAEYAMDVADACRAKGIGTVAVTAGYMHDIPRRDFYSRMDAANVDLKAFTDEFYFKLCGAHLQPVLDTLVYLKHETHVWFEITTLLIPGRNDSVEEVTAMCDWIMRELGPDVPLHFTAFHPDHKMTDIGATPPATLTRSRQIALDAGLRYVYTGNVHDLDGGTTYCPQCHAPLIVRDWHQIKSYKLTPESKCPHCATTVAGEFELFEGQFGRRRIPLSINRR